MRFNQVNSVNVRKIRKIKNYTCTHNYKKKFLNSFYSYDSDYIDNYIELKKYKN
jgi:hypothetical protein